MCGASVAPSESDRQPRGPNDPGSSVLKGIEGIRIISARFIFIE